MKKIIAILLCLALLLGCAAGIAESAEKETLGTLKANGEFTLKGTLPEGYRNVPFELSEDALLTLIAGDDPARPEIRLSIAFDELYANVERLNDLDDDALAVLEKSFTDTDPFVNITYDETAYGTRLMVARTQSDYNDYLDILTIYQGYMVELVMTPGETAAEQRLTEEDTETCVAFLSELDFISGIEAEELVLANSIYTADITGFDPEARTLDVTLLVPYTYTEWEVVSVSKGDTIRLGGEDVEIESLVYDEDDVIINEEYILSKNVEGLYIASSDYGTYPLLRAAAELTIAVPDTVEYDEGIDTATGEMLEEYQHLGATELFAALEAAEQGSIGFDAQNVSVIFDENGELMLVERFYTPWQ